MTTAASGITIVGASAGSGKTYRLTREVTAALSPTEPTMSRIDLPGLVAVTFTRKAHAELEARIRHRLVQDEAYDEAMRLPLAYIGTVHKVALSLLQEFAIDAGLSPDVDVVAGNDTRLLRQSFDRTHDGDLRRRLDDLAARLELRIDSTRNTDWVSPVADIMDLARSNRIAPIALPAMAARSVEGLLALLPAPATDATSLDEALAHELEAAIAALARANDGRKNTNDALHLLQSAMTQLADGELRWSDWAKVAAVSPSKACEACVLGVRAAASRYEEHPRLRDELGAITHAIFDAARAGLVAYQAWKKERHVVDYVDMLDGALDLLEHERVRTELARRLRFVVVDEFQDTSPIQLALFVRLHALAGRSVWVGDRKQCIFEYAGADPVLMDAVADWVERTGGARDRLSDNYRSRPELVDASSKLFATALARHGFTPDEVVVDSHRAPLHGLRELPPLGVWALETESKPNDAEAVAEGVRRLLEAPDRTPVLDRATKRVRAVRAGDIAILVATNDWAARVANALHARGVRVATARAGLFATPEGSLAEAALRWLVDDRDGLSGAVIDALTGWGGREPDEWLAARLREVARKAASQDQSDEPESGERTGWRGALDALRERLVVLSPTEVLDAALATLDLTHLCARWPDPAQRIANLDALRGAAASYEARCAQEREAATVAGLLRYFESVQTPTLQRNELLPSDDQHVPADDGAVVVCTYHKSKGLEWPVVVLAELDKKERRSAFDVAPEAEGAAFDPQHPLANRWVRYWPWPLGLTTKVPLRDAAERCPEGSAVSAREDRERVRVLYVGFTRARDHLVLAVPMRRGKPKTSWLDALCDAEGTPLIELPIDASDGAVVDTRIRVADGDALAVPTRVHRLTATRGATTLAAASPAWFARPPTPGPVFAPVAYRIVPSAGVSDWPELAARVAHARVGAVERLSGAMKLSGAKYDYEVLGNALHGFLAADIEGIAVEDRSRRAGALVEGAGLAGVVGADAFVAAGDALRAWVERKWPCAVWHREIPIDGIVASEHGERRVSGIIDLLLETDAGYVLLDHKSFPAGAESAWRAQCATFIPQLAAYAWLLEAMGDKPLVACWVHLPVAGGMVEIELPRGPK
jgi:ATP-dependent exoDNAse (exonuclease V) beta subunit